MFIMSDAPTPPNGGKWELMSYVQQVSSHLPPLGGVGASDMIDICHFYCMVVLFDNSMTVQQKESRWPRLKLGVQYRNLRGKAISHLATMLHTSQ